MLFAESPQERTSSSPASPRIQRYVTFVCLSDHQHDIVKSTPWSYLEEFNMGQEETNQFWGIYVFVHWTWQRCAFSDPFPLYRDIHYDKLYGTGRRSSDTVKWWFWITDYPNENCELIGGYLQTFTGIMLKAIQVCYCWIWFCIFKCFMKTGS